MKLSQRSLQLLLLFPVLCREVAANTEIINFSSSREQTVHLPLDIVGNWSKLHPSDNERRWTLEPAALHTPLHQVCEQNAFSCPHELWLFLDLDDHQWASFSTFTLRLSWPASTPADFTITTYAPEGLLAQLSERGLISTSLGREWTHPGSSSPHTSPTRHTPTTRSRYAHIRAVHAGVPTPGSRSYLHLPLSRPLPSSLAHAVPLATSPHPQPRVLAPIPTLASRSGTHDAPASLAIDKDGKTGVPFIVILEPLYFGVLPPTLLSTVSFLIPIVLAAAWSVPWITACLEPFVRQAREDLNAGVTRRTS